LPGWRLVSASHDWFELGSFFDLKPEE